MGNVSLPHDYSKLMVIVPFVRLYPVIPANARWLARLSEKPDVFLARIPVVLPGLDVPCKTIVGFNGE